MGNRSSELGQRCPTWRVTCANAGNGVAEVGELHAWLTECDPANFWPRRRCPSYAHGVADERISGAAIRAARERAGLTQTELGDQVGASLRTIGSWERDEHLPKRFPQRLVDFVTLWGNVERQQAEAVAGVSLHSASDAQLLAELGYRLGRARAHADA